MSDEIVQDALYERVSALITTARGQVRTAVNQAMVMTYWQIGRFIVEEEQAGETQAEYGKALIKRLAERLTSEFGKGYDDRNLRSMRQFYLLFPNWNAVRSNLNWTHYRLLVRVEDEAIRNWYMAEADAESWSTRALERQINSFYYERLLSSQDKKPVVAEANEYIAELSPRDILKDPYVLEFLELGERSSFTESELELALIDRLQSFLLELGKGFSFVARQRRINLEGENFYIDLVFYNYLLKCFVLIDLKIGKLTHQDIGQMDTYVRIYEERFRGTDDNPTLGLILCSERNEAIAKYSVLAESQQIFASKYRLILPTEEELVAELRRLDERIVKLQIIVRSELCWHQNLECSVLVE
jgi:predicted nuclease of restriction endonuclease-like (RecB) superfamily